MTNDVLGAIDSLWNRLLAGGLRGSAVAAEQLAFLLYLRLLHEQSTQGQRSATFDVDTAFSHVRWSSLLKYDGARLLATLQHDLIPAIRSQTSSASLSTALEDAQFALPHARLAVDCRDVVEAIGSEHGMAGLALAYDQVLKLLGLTSTPIQVAEPIADMLVALVGPRPDHVVLDPAVGVGDVLLAAARRSSRQYGAAPRLRGYAADATSLRLALMRMEFQGFRGVTIEFGTPRAAEADIVVGMSPIGRGAKAGSRGIAPSAKRAELAYLVSCAELVRRRGGRASVLVPRGALFGTSREHREVREHILRRADVQAVIDLPPQALGSSDLALSVVLLGAGGPTAEVLFWRATDVDEDALPRLGSTVVESLRAWPRRGSVSAVPHGSSATVDVREIERRQWNLAVGAYVATALPQALEQSPHALLEDAARLEAEIQGEIETLRDLLQQLS